MEYPYVVASKKVAAMPSADLKAIWNALGMQTWTSDDYYQDDITMTEWAALVYSEMNRRGLRTN